MATRLNKIALLDFVFESAEMLAMWFCMLMRQHDIPDIKCYCIHTTVYGCFM